MRRIKEIIKLIDNHFNVVADEGDYFLYTPFNIFRILKDYIEMDFEKNFKEITRMLTNQYSQEWGKLRGEYTFDGWELTGMTSFWGRDYKVQDRHFIRFALKPALEGYYKKSHSKCWSFIKRECITEKVSNSRPDFLNRATISIILDRYKSDDKEISQEAFKILKKFILSPKGIPHKSDLIYQEIRKNYPDGKKWTLVKISIDKYKIPVNLFVEQIVSDLAKSGNEEAKKVLKQWAAKSSEYYQKGTFLNRNIINNISKLLDSDLDTAVEMFDEFINSDYFIYKLDRFDVYDVAKLLNAIINKDFNVGIQILNDLNKNDPLTVNQQVLLFSSLFPSSNDNQDNQDILDKLYREFIDPFLTNLDNNINRIYNRLTHSHAREAIVQFAGKLAKAKTIEDRVGKTLRIIGIFINDPDPFLPGQDPEDPEVKYNEHKRIENGEDLSAITSVRGYCAWVLMNCVTLDGREYLPKIIDLTEILTMDENYYVKHMACFALSQLANNRLKTLSGENVLFFNDNKKTALKMAKRVEKIAFNLLNDISKYPINVQKALSKSIVKVYSNVRALKEKEALILFKNLLKLPDEAINGAAPLIIYYAEFRRDSFKDWKWSAPGLYDDIKVFNDKKIKELLKIIMLKNNSTKAAFSWQSYRLTKDSLSNKTPDLSYNEAFSISIRYIEALIREYDHRTFENVYRFIKDNITQPKKFGSCYKLWQECLKIEKPALEKLCDEGKLSEVYWWPYEYNGTILSLVKERKGEKVFLKHLEYLSKYPKGVRVGNIEEAVNLLKNLPKSNKQALRIFDNLIDRDSRFYDPKMEWLKK